MNKTILKTLRNKIQLKEKNSFVKSKVKKDESILATILKKNGYYFSIIETSIKKNENNTVSLNYNIDLGDKAYIEKIKFNMPIAAHNNTVRNITISTINIF